MGDDQHDWAALYLANRDLMYLAAASVLAGAGLAQHVDDAVQDAMESLMKAPPTGVRDWRAMMVATAKRRALDIVKSAAVRRAGPELSEVHDRGDGTDLADDVSELVDRQRAAATVWDCLSVLDDRHRKVVWQYVALGRPRADVAAEFRVTPARISQMAKHALARLRDAMDREEGVV